MKYNYEFEDIRWQGEIREISSTPDLVELGVQGHGLSLHVIIGKCSQGNFVWIPEKDAGFAMSCPTDIYWNIEQMTQKMEIYEAMLICKGISKYYEKMAL